MGAHLSLRLEKALINSLLRLWIKEVEFIAICVEPHPGACIGFPPGCNNARYDLPRRVV